MATFKAGSLTKETYLEWIDMVQGHAVDCGIWKFIDPVSTVYHLEPQKPVLSDYKENAIRYADLDKDEKEMFKEDNAQYRVDVQSYKQECRLIGELRMKVVKSLHENHRKLIFGHMTCREVLKQIKDRLEPAEDLQRLKIIDDYSRIRITPSSRNIDGWLMEWERTDIMIKRLSDYKLTQDFLSAANPLQPIWVTNKRMEILKLTDKTELKFLDLLLEFWQFWELTEFESNTHIRAFPASLQGLESEVSQKQEKRNSCQEKDNSQARSGELKRCQCGETHPYASR